MFNNAASLSGSCIDLEYPAAVLLRLVDIATRPV